MHGRVSGILRVHALISSLTWGGAEMLLSDFAAGAPEAGIELSVGYLQEVDGSPAAARLRACGIDPELVPITGLVNPPDLLRVRRHVRTVAPDILHTHLGNADLMGGLAARSLGVPVISTIHIMEWERTFRERVKSRLMDLARRTCADSVVTVSSRARQALLDAGYGRGARLVTVHNGVDAQPARGSGPGVRRELGLDPDDLVVVMVSVLREGKGHDVAFRALAALRERHANVRLLVVGDGPARVLITEQARAAGEAVVFAGHRDDVMAVLDAADILLHPSRVDAFPTVLLEAMAASLPVVATSVGGIPEIVEDGRTGLLTGGGPEVSTLLAAVGELAGDPARRAELGAAGRARFEAEFAAGRWAERMRDVYEQALARSR